MKQIKQKKIQIKIPFKPNRGGTVFQDDAINIYNIAQLKAIGTNKIVYENDGDATTFGTGSIVVDDDNNVVTYSSQC